MTLQTFTLGTFAQGAAGGATAFESIATATGTGSSATITFSSIPSTYQHLQIRGIAQDTYTGGVNGTTTILIQFNSDTGSNYTRHSLYGNGSTVTAEGNANLTSAAIVSGITYGTATNVYAASIVDIIDYANTSKYKTLRYFNGADRNASDSTYRVVVGSGLWMSTSAISSITLTSNGDPFTTSSTFALYGIKGA